MKTFLAVVTAVVTAVGIVTPPLAFGFIQPGTEPLPNYDQRFEALQSPGASLGAAQNQAANRLRSMAPDVRITRDKLLASPRLITAPGGFLTGPRGSGGAISDSALAAFPESDSQRVLKAFLNEHSALFGHDASALNSARVQRDYVTPHNGLHTVIWEQTVDQIGVFEGMLTGHITRDGALVKVSSQFVADATDAAARGNPNRAALTANPSISIQRAINLAAANVGLAIPENSVTIVKSPEGAEKKLTAKAPGLFGNVLAQLTWLPVGSDSMRLCWRVILAGPQLEHYMVLVDAESGSIPVRHRLTAHISPATYNVHTNDSPSPFSPGSLFPNGFQPTNQPRSMVTLSALSTNASPEGWIPDLGNTTDGNNATAFLDRNLDLLPDIPQPQGAPNRVFNFTENLNQPPITYANASTVQLFYRANWYHDRLYNLGFTEAAGNFQNNNFGHGGFGNDALLCLVQAGADVGQADNALFFTPPDGDPGICLMFVFLGPTPDRDGSLDQEVVCHEFTHGLSNRLLGGGVGISALQTEGMGEGWSDFFALCLLSEASDPTNGVYAAGGYASYRIGAGYVDNYYYGIRRYPYCTEMSKNPLTFKDIDPTQDDPHSGVPINPIFGGSNPAEVHNQGEVWCMTLREVWANLVSKLGWQVGNEMAMQLVVDGLKLAPANANFLEARDAIIEADLINSGGDNYFEIWAAFAKRGMGFSATSPGSETTVGLLEAFDLPPDLGEPDGILEIKITPPSFEVMLAGETNAIFVRVTDVKSVTNAAVSATVSGGNPDLFFRNDGVAPDQARSNGVYSVFLKVPTNQSSVTLTVVASAPGKETSTNSVTYLIIPPPPNDNFANAIKVPVGGTNYLSNNKIATLETNEPIHGGVISERASLWWNYTPSVNTNVLVDTGGSSIRTVVAVYTNNTLVTLQSVASAAGTSQRPGAFLRFSAVAGRTYRIAVAGYDSLSKGSLTLIVTPGGEADTNAPTVTISSPPNGQVVTTNRLLITGSSVDSGVNASGIREITIRVIGLPTLRPPITTVVSSLTGPLNTNWSQFIGLLPGLNSVEVTATDFSGNRSDPTAIQVTYRALNPPNDFFVAAIALTEGSGTNSVNTLQATKEPGEPNHAGFEGGKSAWWTFTPTNNGALTVSTINSTFDTVMAAYTGPNVTQLTTLAGNDDAFDGAPGGYSQIVLPVRTNKTYRIAVDSYDGSGGVVFLTWSFVPATVFHLTVSNTVGGSATPASMDVLSNAPVTLTAFADNYYQFNNWSGSVSSTTNPLLIAINSDMSVTANFGFFEFTDGFESGNLQHLSWITGGNKPWLVQTNPVAAGLFAARSGAITHNQNSSLILTTNFNAGTGSFTYRVSSEPTFDALKFFIDSVLQQQWSGETGWTDFSFPISAGAHTLEWRYSKDPSLTGGMDAAFLDNLNLPLVLGTSSASAATLHIQRQSDGSLILDVTGQPSQRYIFQSSTNLANWRNISTNIMGGGGTLQIVVPAAPGAQSEYYRAIASP